MDYFVRSVYVYLSFTLAILIQFNHGKEETECAGRNITLKCDNSDWLIQIQFEEYGYVEQSEDAEKCQLTGNHCPKTEFLNPPSVGHCNGYPECTFEVPTDVELTACSKNATAVKIIFTCLPRSRTFNLCDDVYYPNTPSVYLHTPKYPAMNINKVSCTCRVTGQNITVTTLDQTKDQYSNVIYILSSSDGIKNHTKNINSMSVLNRVEFTGVKEVEVILDNYFNNETFRLWMSFHGQGMMLICGSPVIPTAVSSTLEPSYYTSYIPEVFTSTRTLTSTQTLEHNKTVTSSNAVHNTVIIQQTDTKLISPSETQSIQSDSLYNDTRSSTNQSTPQSGDSDWVLIVALSVIFVVIFIFVIIVVAVIMYKRHQSRDLAYSSDNVNRSDPDTIYAYDNNGAETEANAVHF